MWTADGRRRDMCTRLHAGVYFKYWNMFCLHQYILKNGRLRGMVKYIRTVECEQDNTVYIRFGNRPTSDARPMIIYIASVHV